MPSSSLVDDLLFVLYSRRWVEVGGAVDVAQALFRRLRRPLLGVVNTTRQVFLGRDCIALIGDNLTVEVKVADENLDVLLEVPQDLLDMANDSLEHLDATVTNLVDLLLDRAKQHEVDDQYVLLTSDALNASDALFEFHRIPREIKIDHQAGDLKIEAFACLSGTHQDSTRCVFQPSDSGLASAERRPRIVE